jgi:hypothetical protein
MNSMRRTTRRAAGQRKFGMTFKDRQTRKAAREARRAKRRKALAAKEALYALLKRVRHVLKKHDTVVIEGSFLYAGKIVVTLWDWTRLRMMGAWIWCFGSRQVRGGLRLQAIEWTGFANKQQV